MPGLVFDGLVFDGNVEWVIDEYFERYWRDGQNGRDQRRYGCTVRDHGIGRLNRHDHGDPQWNRQPQWGLDHLLLPVRHHNVAGLLDVFGRCWVGLHSHLGLRRGHWAQSEYVLSLSTRGHELGGHVDRR
jgi:hypothetical protein